MKDGSIIYAEPSHVEALIKISGDSPEQIYEKIPNDSLTIVGWLVEYTGMISIWSTGFMMPKHPTYEQVNALHKLIQSNLTQNNKFN